MRNFNNDKARNSQSVDHSERCLASVCFQSWALRVVHWLPSKKQRIDVTNKTSQKKNIINKVEDHEPKDIQFGMSILWWKHYQVLLGWSSRPSQSTQLLCGWCSFKYREGERQCIGVYCTGISCLRKTMRWHWWSLQRGWGGGEKFPSLSS